MIISNAHDRMVDWWALGILAFELIAGIAPFYSENVNDMYKRIIKSPLRFPTSMSSECKDLIRCLLTRDPELRMGAAKDVEELKTHPFFSDLDWDKLLRKEVNPIYKPDSNLIAPDCPVLVNFEESEDEKDTSLPPQLLRIPDFSFSGEPEWLVARGRTIVSVSKLEPQS